MPVEVRDPVIDEIVSRLVARFRPERIYLFGSRARGEAGANSDYDVLLVLGELTDKRYRLCQAAYLALRGVPAAVDVLVWAQSDFEQRLRSPASLPATVLREGRLLYAA
ncbi:MAG TPA: nucleotidyltransferase domain-containing protein [Planctomycetota bacterium]|nr:nucleotidyltransferase domain-containing protein [Planctomycetota bacterium]